MGYARHLGVAAGLAALTARVTSRWIFSTDADTVVPRDWIANILAKAGGANADCVVGLARLDAWRGSAAGRVRYERVLAAKMTDGTHGHVYGANLAVRAHAYATVGGFSRHGHGEDQRLVDALQLAGYSILRTSTSVVTTSGRLDGRADDGLADLLSRLEADAEDIPEGTNHVATATLRR